MKSFKQYISETIDLSDIKKASDVVDIIKKECRPFLESKLSEYRMYRGIKKSEDKDILVKNVRTDRKPKDTANFMQKMYDDYFIKKFGFPYRSASLFTTYNFNSARDYGKVYIIFPIGEIKWCSSEISEDLFSYMFQPACGDESFPKSVKKFLSKRDISDKMCKNISEQFSYVSTTDYKSIKTLIESFRKVLKHNFYSDIKDKLEQITDKEYSEFIKNAVISSLDYADYQENSLPNNTSEIMIQCSSYIAIAISDDASMHSISTEFGLKR